MHGFLLDLRRPLLIRGSRWTARSRKGLRAERAGRRRAAAAAVLQAEGRDHQG